ncbi:MAG: hypothetical protein HQL71_06340 [Magnetococcales bacterium]|nr:hypothetical protein [Magnetococcales bacterium]
MDSKLATILITNHNLEDLWLEKVLKLLPNNINIQLFFVDTATKLVGKNITNIPIVKLVYCAHSHRELKAPKPKANVEAGGLLDLGRMVGDSDYFLSLPKIYKPIKPVTGTKKNIGLVLNENSKQSLEGLRVATGLAGCNHKLTIFYPNNIYHLINNSKKTPEKAKPYLEALTHFGATFQTALTSYNKCECECIIEL